MSINFFNQETENLSTGSFKYAFEDNLKYNLVENKNNYVICQFPHRDDTIHNKYFFYPSDEDRKSKPIEELGQFTFGKIGDLFPSVVTDNLESAIESFKIFLGHELFPKITLSDPAFIDEMFSFEFSKIDLTSDSSADVIVYNGIIPSNITPVTNELALHTIDTSQFTGTIEWSPVLVNDIFEDSIAYIANITLTAKQGFTLIGVDSSIFTIDTVEPTTITYANGILTILFTST